VLTVGVVMFVVAFLLMYYATWPSWAAAVVGAIIATIVAFTFERLISRRKERHAR
jgi:putative flippase GtrA